MKIWFRSQKLLSSLKHGSCGVVPCSSLSHDNVKYMHSAPLHRVNVWNKFLDGMIFFQIWIKCWNLETRCEISNKLKLIFKTLEVLGIKINLKNQQQITFRKHKKKCRNCSFHPLSLKVKNSFRRNDDDLAAQKLQKTTHQRKFHFNGSNKGHLQF